jgi:hypothetical protein
MQSHCLYYAFPHCSGVDELCDAIDVLKIELLENNVLPRGSALAPLAVVLRR